MQRVLVHFDGVRQDILPQLPCILVQCKSSHAAINATEKERLFIPLSHFFTEQDDVFGSFSARNHSYCNQVLRYYNNRSGGAYYKITH